MKCKICHTTVRKKNLRRHTHNPKAYEHFQRSKSGKHRDGCDCKRCRKQREKGKK